MVHCPSARNRTRWWRALFYFFVFSLRLLLPCCCSFRAAAPSAAIMERRREVTPVAERHTTRARTQFAKEFGAAMIMLKKLEQQSPPKSRRPRAAPAPDDDYVDLNGKQTTSQCAPAAARRVARVGDKHMTSSRAAQRKASHEVPRLSFFLCAAVSFQAYDQNAKRLFVPSQGWGRPRDDFTDYCEALFKQRNIFGDPGKAPKGQAY